MNIAAWGAGSVTRGAGQNSTYYGCITDIVAGQKYATPIGTVTDQHLSEGGHRA